LLTRDQGVDIVVREMPLLDMTYRKNLLGSLISDLVLQILSFVAQMERDTLLQRQAEGIAAAKARGVPFGKPPFLLPDDFFAIYRRWRDGALTKEEAALLCGCSVRTLYNKTLSLRGEESCINPV
jgi:DNA invertase Pin-like site-specific DNA recombinase